MPQRETRDEVERGGDVISSVEMSATNTQAELPLAPSLNCKRFAPSDFFLLSLSKRHDDAITFSHVSTRAILYRCCCWRITISGSSRWTMSAALRIRTIIAYEFRTKAATLEPLWNSKSRAESLLASCRKINYRPKEICENYEFRMCLWRSGENSLWVFE